jgi:hypothetical protein
MVVLPEVKIVTIIGEDDIFNIFDFKQAESLRFVNTQWPPRQMRRAIPTQLTRLSIGLARFTSTPLSVNFPQHFPVLVALKLVDVTFDGPAQNYLHCPKLRILSYRVSNPGINGQQNSEDGYELAREAFDEPFIRETPELESILFQGVRVDDILVSILGSCALLEDLIVEDCQTTKFIPAFSKSIKNKEYFPSLTILK